MYVVLLCMRVGCLIPPSPILFDIRLLQQSRGFEMSSNVIADTYEPCFTHVMLSYRML